MDSISINWVIIFLSLLFSAFFSGLEIAFVTANKLRIELESKQGIYSSKIISKFFLKSPPRFIGTMLVGNNIALVVYGIVMAGIIEPVIRQYIDSEFSVLFFQTILSTIIILFTAEFLPKVLFRINPNVILGFFALPALIVYFLLYPIVFITIGLSQFILTKILKINLVKGQIEYGRVDLDNYLKEFGSNSDKTKEVEHEVQIFQNALGFSAIKVRDSMIPRTEIIAVEIDSDISELKKLFIQTGLSKILIFKESTDNIIGYVHSYEMFKRPSNIRSVILPVLIVPETMPSEEAMSQFIQERKSLAVVVDEFGGTSGILTIEDVMEEIFGEIEDEHDVEELEETTINDYEYLFSGRLEVDYLNEEYKLNLPVSDEYETLAGLIISICGSIPDKNEEIKVDGFVFIILDVSETKIEKVKLLISKE
jgi:CBS domain containing-hemolysin-like protein